VKGKSVAKYKVLDQLGRGGMGVVWKGYDERLDRHVALKFLPPELTANLSSREHLVREARAASQLDHPNICTIHEIEETDDGHIVLVMAYYEGETLAQRIRRGRLDPESAAHVLRSMLQGLKHAHDRGVIHRDIKPGNTILCADGGVKIVDFGLAHATGPNQLTITQGLAGTLHYMEPETVNGQHPDHRTDLWSCGVVLYEMLSGTLPFQGEHMVAVLGAISRNEPIPLRDLRPDVPPKFEAIVSRALAKVRGARYQSAGEFLFDLEHFAHASATSTSFSTHPGHVLEKSIVVLPFALVGTTQDSDYFSDGLTDEIITDLSGIRKLRVICRSSAMRLKGTTKQAREIADELKVRYVLEGTVRLSGNHLRVNAQLIDPGTDSPLWAEKYSGTLEDVFSIQSELSRKIVEALRLKLTPDDLERIAEQPMGDIRAYEYYLRAKKELLSYSREALDSALAYLDKGEQIIGENVLLLSARGFVHWQFVNAGIDGDPIHLRKAEECAHRILHLQPSSAHGHRLLGLVAVVQGKTQEAVRQLKRSLEIAPGDPDSMAWLCALCALSGKGQAVTAMAKRLVEIDPLTPTYHFMPGFVALLSGDFERALGPFEEALRGEPSNQMLRLAFAQALVMKGDTERANEGLESLAKDNPGDFFAQLALVLHAGLAANLEAIRANLTESVSAAASGDMNYAWLVAQAWALGGNVDECLYWLQLAVDHGFINYPMLSRYDPTLASVRDEGRFQTLLESARKAWDAFEV
jgi:non-specific serine/threonine protein kinase